MNSALKSWWWKWRWQVGGLVAVTCSTSIAVAQCSNALDRLQVPGLKLQAQERLVAVQHDPLLGSDWGSVVACDHPERPARFIALPAGFVRPAPATTPASHLVETLAVQIRAGQRVLLWRQDGMTRIETVGTADESAVDGQHIRVRLLTVALDGPGARASVVGIVRGPGSVEILR